MRELSARLALRVFPIPPRSPFVSPAKAGAQEPRWCRGHGADLSAAGSPPARFLSSLERQHPSCRGGYGGSMSFWLPSRARWSLDPGVRLEDDERALRPIGPSAFFRFLRALPSFPPQKRGPRNRGGATPTGRISAQRIFRQHDARVLLIQDSALRAAEAMAVRCPLGCHPELGGPWVPAFAGKTMRELSARLGPPRFSDSSALSLRFPREIAGLGTAVAQLPRNGPQRRGFAAGVVCGLLCEPAPSVLPKSWPSDVLLAAIQSSVVPGSRRSPGRRGGRKRGPRSRGGAVATERASVQWVFCWHDVWTLAKNSTLPAAEPLVARCPFGCHPGLGGPWVPAFAGKTRSRIAGAQGPW